MKLKWIVLLCLLAAASGYARPRRKARPSRWAIGVHLLLSFPQSDSAHVAKSGEGLGGKVLFSFPKVPYVALRGDFGYLTFGETRTSFYGYSIAQTRKEAFRGSFGPQFQINKKKLKAYLAPMIGLYNYRTVFSYQDYYYYGYGYSDTKESNTRYGWNISAGVSVDINLGPWIDVGIQYHNRHSAIVKDGGVVVPKGEISATVGVVFFLKN